MIAVVRWACLSAAALVLFGVACSSSDRGFEDGGDGVFGSDAGNDVETSACGGRRCSRDLHAIIDDCTEAVVQECPADLGCANGACVPACESAAASQGSVGCSFFTIPPDSLPSDESSCYVAFVANTWNAPVHVAAEFDGRALDISKSTYRAISRGAGVEYQRIEGAIPPLELGIVFLSQGERGPNTSQYLACPEGVSVAWSGVAVKEHRTSVYPAFHLKTDAPVSAYSLFPYGGAKSYSPAATLLLPTPSWHTNYILVDGWTANVGPPFVQIVAQEDGTEVRMRPQVDILAGSGVQGGIRGAVSRWTLNRGEVLEFTQPESLAGSPIEASHPVAVFGGNQCANLPDSAVACDSLHQQIPPIPQWSSNYSGVPYESRRKGVGPTAPESVFWRIVGAADGTVLTYDPKPPDAPATLKSGQVSTFTSEHPFAVKSQDVEHPFFLAVHMSGAWQYHTLGDPDFVTVVPNEQFLDHYVFFLDYTFSDSNLTVVRRKGVNGFQEVMLDCVGAVTGWRPLGSDGTTEYAWVGMTRGHVPITTSIGACEYGRHEARSDGPFALYVWGIDDSASYGFPAGAGSRPITPYSITVR